MGPIVPAVGRIVSAPAAFVFTPVMAGLEPGAVPKDVIATHEFARNPCGVAVVRICVEEPAVIARVTPKLVEVHAPTLL